MNSACMIGNKGSMDGWASNYLIEDKNNTELEYCSYDDATTMLVSKKIVKITIVALLVISIVLPVLLVSSIKGRMYKKELDAANTTIKESPVPGVTVNNNIFPKGVEDDMGRTDAIPDIQKAEPEASIQTQENVEEEVVVDDDANTSSEEFTPQKIGSIYLRELKPMVDSGTWNMGEAWWSPQYLNTGEEICYAIASSRSQTQDELTYYIGDQTYSRLTARYAWWNKYNSEKSLKSVEGACAIYGDGKLLWSSPVMDVYSMPEDVDIEIPTGCQQLTILFANAGNGVLMDPKLSYK